MYNYYGLSQESLVLSRTNQETERYDGKARFMKTQHGRRLVAIQKGAGEIGGASIH